MAAQTTGPQTAADGELRLEMAPQLPALEAYAERTGLPTETAYQVTLVLDELVTNIVSYGVAPGETRPITLNLSCAGDVLEVVLSDPGKPFHPRSVPPARHRSLARRPPDRRPRRAHCPLVHGLAGLAP